MNAKDHQDIAAIIHINISNMGTPKRPIMMLRYQVIDALADYMAKDADEYATYGNDPGIHKPFDRADWIAKATGGQ